MYYFRYLCLFRLLAQLVGLLIGYSSKIITAHSISGKSLNCFAASGATSETQMGACLRSPSTDDNCEYAGLGGWFSVKATSRCFVKVCYLGSEEVWQRPSDQHLIPKVAPDEMPVEHASKFRK